MPPILGIAVPRTDPPRLDRTPHPYRPPRQGTLDAPMSNTATQLPPFGWYPDPAGSLMLRWWDGQAWTNRLEKPRPEIQTAKGFAQQQSTLSRLIAS